jgi:hypothetical protein
VDEAAKKELEKLGWSPKRINASRKNSGNKGMPDFICTNGIYVEVKKITSRPAKRRLDNKLDTRQIGIHASQLARYAQMGEEIYLMVFPDELDSYEFYAIKHTTAGEIYEKHK